MLALASQLAAAAWASDQVHTAYFEPADAAIRRLYESDDLTAFIAAVLGKRVLYRSADPLDALEIAIFGDGDELGWHFDNSEFSVPAGRGRGSFRLPRCARTTWRHISWCQPRAVIAHPYEG